VIYLCRGSRQAAFPRIYVYADDFPGLDRVTAEGVQEFASGVRAELRLANANDRREVSGVIIGDFVGAAYPGRGEVDDRGKKKRLDLLTVVTVRGGRKYRLELRAEEGTLSPFIPILYAMAGGLKFVAADAKNAEPNPFGTASEDTKKKSDDKPAAKPGDKPAK